MSEPRQKIMLALGEGGCYFLSLIHIAEDLHSGRRIDAVEAFLDSIHEGYCKEDCFIVDPAAIMRMLYGGQWSWRKEGPEYLPGEGEFEILRFERTTPARVYNHFVLGDGKGKVLYDPLGASQTVASGALVSKRIMKLVIGEES